MIRIGIIGSNYGRMVLLPAFRADRRCEVIALGGSNAARTAELASAAGIARAYSDWRAVVDDKDVQAIV
ncbi:MAG: Gfo/Idh/MocA family oxidoreductase, partial [Hyphomicrobiales bacterium]